MKLIETFKSPNFDKRNHNSSIKYIILHYTAMKDCMEAIEHMCSAKKKVSSHFLISKNGDIYYLVNTKYRAWHAGISYWNGLTDINSSSIGIELDNSGNLNNFEQFSNLQINSLIDLIFNIKKKYKISKNHILGHSDVSPYRKIDPGEKFPWKFLYKNNLSYLPIIKFKNEIEDINNLNLRKRALKFLKKIGYDTNKTINDPKRFYLLIRNYQRHYRQSKISGILDIETYNLIEKHYKDILTY